MHVSRHLFCAEFTEKIEPNASKGWVRILNEKDPKNEVGSFVEDGWLVLYAKITPLEEEGNFQNALLPVPKQISTKLLPDIDPCRPVQIEGDFQLVPDQWSYERMQRVVAHTTTLSMHMSSRKTDGMRHMR